MSVDTLVVHFRLAILMRVNYSDCCCDPDSIYLRVCEIFLVCWIFVLLYLTVSWYINSENFKYFRLCVVLVCRGSMLSLLLVIAYLVFFLSSCVF